MESSPDFELDVEDVYKPIYRKYYSTIRTRITKGRHKTVYHFLVTGDYSRSKAKDFISSLDLTINNPQSTNKINIAFGFILRDHNNNQMRFFHPSYNSMLYEVPMEVNNRKDIQRMIDDLDFEDARAYAMAHRPSTIWRMEKIVCVRFDVYKSLLPNP